MAVWPPAREFKAAVDRGQKRPDLRLVAVEGVVELMDDRLQLVDPTAVQDERQSSEGVLDARGSARVALGDESTALQVGTCRNLRPSSPTDIDDGPIRAQTYSSPSGLSNRIWAVVPTGRSGRPS